MTIVADFRESDLVDQGVILNIPDLSILTATSNTAAGWDTTAITGNIGLDWRYITPEDIQRMRDEEAQEMARDIDQEMRRNNEEHLHTITFEDIERRIVMRVEDIQLNEVIYVLGGYLRTEKYPDGLSIADDLGNHRHCYLGTNCPEAVKLRKVLSDAGVSNEELLEAYKASQQPDPPPPYRYTLPELSGKAVIVIGGQQVEIDLGSEIENQFRTIAEHKWNTFNKGRETFLQLMKDMLYTYIQNIHEARRTKAMSQLVLPVSDLIKYEATMSTNGKDCYWIIMPFDYLPKYVYSEGYRYRIAKEDEEAIARRVHIVFPISVSGSMFEPFLIENGGEKFQHYHGGGHDCWGGFKLLSKWNKTLKELYNYRIALESALVTINRNSPMMGVPKGMPALPDLFLRCTKLGKEGTFTEGAAAKDRAFDEEEAKNASDKKKETGKAWGTPK